MPELSGADTLRRVVKWMDQNKERWFDDASAASILKVFTIISAYSHEDIGEFLSDRNFDLASAQNDVQNLLGRW